MQDYSNREYIVIDGNSSDGTMEVLNEYRSKIDVLISEDDNGYYHGLNKAVLASRGEIVGILNGDDYFFSIESLSKIVGIFENFKCDGVYADLIYVGRTDRNKVLRYWISGKQKSMLSGWHPPHPALFLKRSVYEEFGLYDVSFTIAADFDFMLRVIEKENVSLRYLPEIIICMRSGGMSNHSLRNIYEAYHQIRYSFRKNGFKFPLLYPVKRYSSKITQFFMNPHRMFQTPNSTLF